MSASPPSATDTSSSFTSGLSSSSLSMSIPELTPTKFRPTLPSSRSSSPLRLRLSSSGSPSQKRGLQEASRFTEHSKDPILTGIIQDRFSVDSDSCCGVCGFNGATKSWSSDVSRYAHRDCILKIENIERRLISYLNSIFRKEEHHNAAHKAAIVAVKEEIRKEKKKKYEEQFSEILDLTDEQETLFSYLHNDGSGPLQKFFESAGIEAAKQYMDDISRCGICEDPKGTELWPSEISDYAHSDCVLGVKSLEEELRLYINHLFKKEEQNKAAHKAAIVAVKEEIKKEIMKEKEAESPGSSDVLSKRVTIFSYLSRDNADELKDIFNGVGIEAVKEYARGFFNKLYPSTERLKIGSRGSIQIKHRGFGFIVPSESDKKKLIENLVSLDCVCGVCETPDKHFPWGRDSSHIPWSEKTSKYIFWTNGCSSHAHSSCYALIKNAEKKLVREIEILFSTKEHRDLAHKVAMVAVKEKLEKRQRKNTRSYFRVLELCQVSK